ncbi:hypothetical protein N0V88_005317 [Collariella sp. IMI 366227]|nr:hypothetical protein N0V88_005317 [Collariella sp. IMI 366227]
MHANPLLHAQFPTPESLAALERVIAAHTAARLHHAAAAAVGNGSDGDGSSGDGGGVLIAQEFVTGEIVGFVKWDAPGQGGKKEERLKENEGEEGDGKLEMSVAGVEGGLSFVCIDPAYQGQGAGSQLTRRVLGMAAEDGLPVYLESTENAVGMYEKLGFKVVDGFEMRIPSRGSSSDELSEVYREHRSQLRQPSLPEIHTGHKPGSAPVADR